MTFEIILNQTKQKLGFIEYSTNVTDVQICSVSKDDETGGDPRTEKILELDDFSTFSSLEP